MMSKIKNTKIDNRNKCLKKKIFKISIGDRCNQCQRYGHIAVDCTSPFKVALINKVLIVSPESERAIYSEITSMI